MTDQSNDPLYCRWNVLDHLLKDLIHEYEIERSIIENLQLSKTLINYYIEDPSDPSRSKEIGRIDELLNESEQTLMIIADQKGDEYIDMWNEHLINASKGIEVFRNVPIQSKFIAGMPANFDFVRFNFKEPIAEERFMEICEYENVIIEYDDNDISVFVFGEKPQITSALKEMGSFFAEQTE